MDIVAGKMYFGAFNERLAVTAVHGHVVHFIRPISGTTGRMGSRQFSEWAGESTRRTYVGADGEHRVKLRTDHDRVFYTHPSQPYQQRETTPAAWAAWRAQAR